MNTLNEYALLVAVAVPVLAIAGLNAFLWIGGERGTLMLPDDDRTVSTRGKLPRRPRRP